jgi:peroxiredoxin
MAAGQRIEYFTWRSTAGAILTIPDSDGQLINPQFSRFAACPVCNMHFANYRSHSAHLQRAGVKVVVVFHSPEEDVEDLRGDLPFALVTDPYRRNYTAFGVGTSALPQRSR